MGLFGKLFGSGKTEVTPDKMAHVVLNAAVELAVSGEESVRGLLLKAGVEEENEARFQAELVAYQLFLLDVIVNRVFGEEADRIRKHMRERFADQAARVARAAGAEPKAQEEYIAFLEDRFREYAPALRRSMESEGEPEQGALALPEAVLSNVAGPGGGDVMAQMAMSAQWTHVFKEYPEAFQEYEIVEE